MVKQKVVVKNEQGIHMRPAGIFVKEMGKFTSQVNILVNGNKVNGKSVMFLMGAGIKCNTEIEIECIGDDEKEALQAAITLIESGLGE